MKKSLRWSGLAGLALAVVLGAGICPRTTRAQTAADLAQTTAGASNGAGAQSGGQAAAKEQPEQNGDDAYLKSPSVVWLGKRLGIGTDHASKLADLGNFLVLAVLVVWGVAKFLPKTIRDRNTTIQKDLVDARTATEEASARLSGVEERLGKLDGEIAAMRAHAGQDLVLVEQRIKAAVEEEKKRILKAAEQEIVSATGHAQKRLRQYAAELAIEQAAQKLTVSAEADRLLVQGFAQRLAGDDPKKGQN